MKSLLISCLLRLVVLGCMIYLPFVELVKPPSQVLMIILTSIAACSLLDYDCLETSPPPVPMPMYK